MLIHLSLVEPGENFRNEEYAFDRNYLPMPGWELKVTWLQEENLPLKGILSMEIYAGEGMNMNECQVSRRVRNMMMSLVLVRQRDIHQEVLADQQLVEAAIAGINSGFSMKESRLEYASSDHAKVSAFDHNSHKHHAHLSRGASHGATPPTSTPHTARAHVTFSEESVKGIGAPSTSGHHSAEAEEATVLPMDGVLYDSGMQLAYQQLSALELYENGKSLATTRAVVSSGKTISKTNGVRAKTEELLGPNFENLTRSDNSKFMKTYRLDDLHANLKSKTSITWTYAPPQIGKAQVGRAALKNGT